MTAISKAANAEVLLLRAKKGNAGLSPEDVIAFAQNENTALHRCFEWDDSAAAHQFRIDQARNVLRVTVEVVREHHEPIRAFVSLSSDRGTGGGYRRLRDVMNNAEQRAVYLQDALADLRMYKDRYQSIQELAKVWEAIDEVESTATRKRRKAA